MKKVSVVVPVYKSELYLEKLIESILNQNYSNLEIILVDDGSPDNSGKICDDYAQKDLRVIAIHQKNEGCCNARNKGIQAATGEYLIFADGDDWMEPDCIEYLVSLMENNNCQMAMSDSIFTTRDRIQNETDNIRIWTREEAICGILYVSIPIGPWNKIYSMNVIRENELSFSVPWFGEGLYFSTMAAQYSNKVAVGHRKVYNYRMNNPNSGLTVRQVQHAINALWNIKNIKERLVVRTPATIHSAESHICNNYYFLMQYIVWSNSISEYYGLYKEARNKLFHLLPNVFLHAKIGPRRKVRLLIAWVFPKALAKYEFKKMDKQFKEDIME